MSTKDIISKLIDLSSKVDILLFEKNDNTLKWTLKDIHMVNKIIEDSYINIYEQFCIHIKPLTRNNKYNEIVKETNKLNMKLMILQEIKNNIKQLDTSQKPKRVKKFINNDIIIESFSTNNV